MDFGYNPYQYGQQPQMPQRQFFPQQPPSLIGKMVSAQTDIMPGDVPMNGNPCFFPMQDGSAIFAKVWNSDGTISTMKFVPEAPAPKEPTQLDRIESMLSSFIGSKEVDDA